MANLDITVAKHHYSYRELSKFCLLKDCNPSPPAPNYICKLCEPLYLQKFLKTTISTKDLSISSLFADLVPPHYDFAYIASNRFLFSSFIKGTFPLQYMILKNNFEFLCCNHRAVKYRALIWQILHNNVPNK